MTRARTPDRSHTSSAKDALSHATCPGRTILLSHGAMLLLVIGRARDVRATDGLHR